MSNSNSSEELERRTETLMGKPLALFVWTVALLVLGLQLFRGFAFVVDLLCRGGLCHRDFVPFFVVAKIAFTRMSAQTYEPLTKLMPHVLPQCVGFSLTNSLPYPPAIFFFSWAWKSSALESASYLWAVVSVALYILGVRLVIPGAGWKRFVLSSLGCLAIYPVHHDIGTGNIGAIGFFLLALALYCVSAGYVNFAAIPLGIALSFKFWGWLVLLTLVLTRQSNFAGSILGVGLGITLFTLGVGGPGLGKNWVESVSGATVAEFSNVSLNQTLGTLPRRLFEGMDPQHDGEFALPPLVNAPTVAPVATALLWTSVAAWFCNKSRKENLASALVRTWAAGSLLMPVVWGHYFTVFFIPLILNAGERSMLSRPWAIMCTMVLLFGDLIPLSFQREMWLPPTLVSLVVHLPAVALLFFIATWEGIEDFSLVSRKSPLSVEPS